MTKNELDINHIWAIESVSVNDIPSKVMKEICSKIFSHLSTNGHVANITEQHQDSYDLVWKET